MTWVGHSVDATYWDDLKTPASGINPAGAASPPGQDTSVMPGTLLFDASGVEVVALVVQMSHSYKEDTAIVPHVHWTKTTSAAGNVLWRLRYKVVKIGEVGDADFTTLTTSSTVEGTPDNDTANEHLISTFGEVTISGFQISDMLVCELSRVGSDAADTYGADARLLEFDIHYQRDEPGSRQEFRKAHIV